MTQVIATSLPANLVAVTVPPRSLIASSVDHRSFLGTVMTLQFMCRPPLVERHTN
jgi:hypothetical protein